MIEYMTGLYYDRFTVHINICPCSYHISKNKLGCPAVMEYISGLYYNLFSVHIFIYPSSVAIFLLYI